MTRPRFGLGLRADTQAPAELAALAERGGFDVVTVFNDLGFGPPLPSLLAAASATERVRLGVACYNPYTTPAVEIARQVDELDAASGGRAYVGLARGAWLDRIGVAQPRPVGTLRETAAAIKRLLGRDVPLLIGGWGPRVVALAGEIADELKVGGSANPDLVPVMRKRLGVASATRIVMGAVTVVDADRRAARERALAAVAMYFDVVARHDPTVEATALSDGRLDRFAFAGTARDVALQARRLFDTGADRVEFGVPFGLDSREGVRALAEKVLPEFR